LIFAIEEETNLTQRFEIAFVGQLHHSRRIRSSMAIRGKRKVRQRERGERHASNNHAAVENQIEFAHRQRDPVGFVVTPQRSEAQRSSRFVETHRSRAVEMEHLGADAVATEEEKHVAAERIATQPLLHDRTHAIETLAHIGGQAVCVDRDPPSVRRHGQVEPPRSSLPTATTGAATRGATPSVAATTLTGRYAACAAWVRCHRERLHGATPSTTATARTPAPAR